VRISNNGLIHYLTVPNPPTTTKLQKREEKGKDIWVLNQHHTTKPHGE